MRPRASSATSLGELKGRPSNRAARITLLPVFMSVRVIRRPPNQAPSATTSRPWASNSIPLDMPLGERNTVPVGRRCRTLGEESLAEQALELGTRSHDGRIALHDAGCLCDRKLGREGKAESDSDKNEPSHRTPPVGPHPLSPSPSRRGGTSGVPPLPKGEGVRG